VGTFGNGLFVLPPIDSTIFGIPCSANTLTSLSGVPGLPSIQSRYVLCLDAEDNLYMGIYSTGNGLYVIPQTTTTIFGVACTANESNNLTPSVDPTDLISSLTGMAFDADGNLFLANGWGTNGGLESIFVLPPVTATVFGVLCTENILTNISVVDPDTILDSLKGICFDSAGNLYIGNNGNPDRTICVLPRNSGTLFGVSVVQNIVSVLTSATTEPQGVRIDPMGNLFWIESANNTLHVLPAMDTTLYGVPCSMNVPTDLTPFVDPDETISNPYDLCFDINRNLFLINRDSATPAVLPHSQTLSFPLLGFGIYVATDATILFPYNAVQDFLAGKRSSVTQGSFVTPGTILTDLRRDVYIFGKNNLKTYQLREVQLPGSLRSVYLCVWAASGVSPSMLS